MSAEELREAARLMRERAGKATPGVWEPWSGATAGGGEYISAKSASGKFHYTFGISPGLLGEEGWRVAERDAQHIASWHPAVALAVADWLDYCAGRRDRTSDARIRLDEEEQAWYLPALAIARAYLGTPPPDSP